MKLVDAYLDYVLTEGRRPATVYAFTKKLKIQESAFYQEFSSFEALEEKVLKLMAEEVIQSLTKSEEWPSFTAREKVLSFFFALIEKLKEKRSFLQWLQAQTTDTDLKPAYLKGLKHAFEQMADSILAKGIDDQEVKKRGKLSDKYTDALWIQFLFIYRFWLKDTSSEFEKTDEAIEKSVNLYFDLVGQSPLDSMIEFGKFLLHNRPF